MIRVLGETIVFLAVFMLGHAFARFLMRVQHAVSITAGLLLEGALRAAGYILGLSFLGQTWEILLQAAFHMSRVRDDSSGRPTQLSELHMTQAAHPIQQLIANALAIIGTLGFGALIKRIRARRSRAVWEDPNRPPTEQQATSETGTPPPESGTATEGTTSRTGVETGTPPRETLTQSGTPPPTQPAVDSTSGTRPLEAGAQSSTADPTRVTTADTTTRTTGPVEVGETPPEATPLIDPSTRVWVNTRSGRYHLPDSHYYGTTAEGEYMTRAEAEAQGHLRAGSGARPPSGVYSVVRPTEGDPRVVILSWIGERQRRAGLEREMMSAAEYAAAELEGFQRAHSQGAGLGIESEAGIRLASELVNQVMQRRGIEGFLRALRDVVEGQERLHLTTETQSHPQTLRLSSIHYVVESPEGGRMITLFEAVIEMRPDGSARCGVRMAGSDAYTFGPWFAE